MPKALWKAEAILGKGAPWKAESQRDRLKVGKKQEKSKMILKTVLTSSRLFFQILCKFAKTSK